MLSIEKHGVTDEDVAAGIELALLRIHSIPESPIPYAEDLLGFSIALLQFLQLALHIFDSIGGGHGWKPYRTEYYPFLYRLT